MKRISTRLAISFLLVALLPTLPLSRPVVTCSQHHWFAFRFWLPPAFQSTK